MHGSENIEDRYRDKAAVHKQVLEPLSCNYNHETNDETEVFQMSQEQWEKDGVSMAVRVLIGSLSTEWMQTHQRWWEGRRTEKGRQIGRRRTKGGSTGDLFGKCENRTNAAQGVEWSSDSEHSAGSGSTSSGSGSDDGSEGVAAAVDSPVRVPRGFSIPMPRLPASPKTATPLPLPLPLPPSLSPVAAAQRVVAEDKARRRSSMSAIRAFFHRAKGRDGEKEGGAPEAEAEAEGRGRRAASVSEAAVPSTPTSPHASALRRTAASKRMHSVTWRRKDEAGDPGDPGDRPPHPQLLSPPALSRTKPVSRETGAVLLTAQAIVRIETATGSALGTAYTEATCRALRLSSHEWAEMWAVLTSRGLRFFAGGCTRARAYIAFPPCPAASGVVPRLSVFSALDVSLALAYASRSGKATRVAVFRLRTAAEARLWYVRIAALLAPNGAAAGVPRGVTVHVPELGVKVRVRLGVHGRSVWDVRAACARALLGDAVVAPGVRQWLALEQQGLLRVGMAWRRGSRLAWVAPGGSVAGAGAELHVVRGESAVAGPALAERSHVLEMRTMSHYPGGTGGVAEPLGVEGFVLLRRARGAMAAYRPVLLAVHDGLLFLVHAPRGARHLDAAGEAAHGAVRFYHPDARRCARQMGCARFVVSLAAVGAIAAVDGDEPAGPGGPGGPGGSRRPWRLPRPAQQRPPQCKFRLAAHDGGSSGAVELWAESEAAQREWVQRLSALRHYWVQRAAADSLLRSRLSMLNYAQQGRRGREEPPDSDGLASVAERGLWHACALLGCRTVIMAGMLYRKRHRHQGMRRVFCVLTRGRLVEFDYPHAGRLAGCAPEHLRAGCLSVLSSPSANAGSARLLFARSRTLALRRCYVVSRRADDLTTEDIMCEPWVMTDIGNYSGLRLADRLYADGTVSHDLIDDCIFTVWRPKAILPPPCHRVDASEGEMVPASPRSSSDTQRPEIDGYASSESSAGGLGAVDDVRVGLEGRHSPRRMAVGSGVKKRLGVFKARSNAEMELWVTAINQEIRRMIESDEW